MGKILFAFQWFTLLGLSACTSGAPKDAESEKTTDLDVAVSTSELHGGVDSTRRLQLERVRNKRLWPRHGRGHWHVPSSLDGTCKPECALGNECKHGHCVPAPCPKGQTRCDGQCIDTRNDEMNCGGCAYPSTSNGYVKPVPCRVDPRTGVCGCDPNLIDLATVCGDQCVDVNADPNHCGACGHSCKGDERCESGACVRACAAGKTLVKLDQEQFVSYDCYDARPGEHCAGSGIADAAACVAGQCQCAFGSSLCSDPEEPTFKYCADLANDREHCGTCNKNCGIGTECVAGACKPIVCPEGRVLCRDTCVDVTSDELACGGCTGMYPVPREIGGEGRIWSDDTGTIEAICSQGTCYCDVWNGPPDRCALGDRQYCANFQQDRDNCGGCGVTCARDEHCVAGACVPECGPGFTLEFAGFPAESYGLRGSCVNGDVVGDICVAEATCEAGRCVCPSGQVACRNPSDAPVFLESQTHCTDLSNSPLHCGACGSRCALGTACNNGRCVALTCPTGKIPCGHECSDVTSDANNCGGCSASSGLSAFFTGGSDDASPACENPWSCHCTLPGAPDVCGYQCTDLQRDEYNCGACGVACPDGQACRNGRCDVACGSGQTYCDGYCVLGTACGQTCQPSVERCLAGSCVTAP